MQNFGPGVSLLDCSTHLSSWGLSRDITPTSHINILQTSKAASSLHKIQSRTSRKSKLCQVLHYNLFQIFLYMVFQYHSPDFHRNKSQVSIK